MVEEAGGIRAELINAKGTHEIHVKESWGIMILEGGNGGLVAELKFRDIVGAVATGSALEIRTYRKVDRSLWSCWCFCENGDAKVLGCINVQLGSPELSEYWEKTLSGTEARGPFVVVVNPSSGTRRGKNILEREVEPMLRAGRVHFTTLITSRANEATEYIRDLEDLGNVEAILCVGGDGTLFEVLQGIRDRADVAQILAKVKLVPVPAGTGNGLAKSLTYEAGEECNASSCTFLGIKGMCESMDLIEVQSDKKSERMYSFLLLGFGLVADVDILSETMRYLGEMRLHIAAVYYILRKRLYKGKVTIIPYVENSAAPTDAVMPAFNAPFEINGFPSSEVVSEGPFCLVWVVQTSHCTEHMYSGPECKIGSGYFTIYWVEVVSRCDMLSLLLTIDTGGHNDHPKVHRRKAVAYRIEPDTMGANGEDMKDGFYTLDGEIVPNGAIQGIIRPGGCRTSMLGPDTS